jgi:hypothetical protein
MNFLSNKKPHGNRQWVFNLHAGDEIAYEHEPKEVKFVFISSIEYLPENVVRILTKDGERIECNVNQIL